MRNEKNQKSSRSTAEHVRERINRGGSRFWKHENFAGLPPSAVATELSRLAREGELTRMGKGLYYRPVPTSFGPSLPSASSTIAQRVRAPLHAAGASAANALGFTTQNPRLREYATPAAAPPTALRNAIVHTGRPRARASLSFEDGALLELLRERGESSDLSAEETVSRLLQPGGRREAFYSSSTCSRR